MAVYEGVLKKISEGDVISGEPRGAYYVERFGVIRKRGGVVDDHAGWMRRQFVDVGDTRIRTVMLMRYHDALLQEALGQEVALSITGPKPSSGKRHTVVAIRTPSVGVVKPTLGQLWTAAIWVTLRTWIGAVFATLFLFIAMVAVAYGGYALYRNWELFVVVFFIEVAIALAFFVWLIVSPVVDARRMFRAASALDETSASAVPTMIS